VNDYVVATFVVVWFVLLIYVAALAMRSARMGREVQLLTRLVERRAEASSDESDRP